MMQAGASRRSGPALWTPAQIATSIWLDASTSSTITTSGGTVSEWRDRSGNNRHISQAVTAQQPTLVAGGLNGLPVITFDGVNDILLNAAVGAAGLTSVSIIAVFKMNSGGTSEDIPMGVGETGQVGRIRVLYRAGSGTTVGFASWARDVPSSAYSYDIGGGYHIFEAWNTQLALPNNVVIGRDGLTTTYSSSSAGLSTTVDGFSMGSLRGSAVANYYAAISVAEVVILYSAVTSTDRVLIEGYLAWKWGLQANLPAGHLYKSAAPTA